jgi:tRNA threonylcarbamoyladenosine biosynthesis protein TsaB
MHLLAFETATRRVSVALWRDGDVLERFADMPNNGSEVLLPWAQALLAEAGITLQQLDAIAFGAGPGGFTGLRLACGVTQGLAFGLDRPVVPVSTLAALALNAGDGVVWTLLDARMNEVYGALYRVAGESVTELSAPICAPPQQLAVPNRDSMPPAPTFAANQIVGAGDGFSAYADALQTVASSLVAVYADLMPSAAAVARLAAPLALRGDVVNAADAQPIYVREKVALTTAERLARGGVR